MPQSSELFSVYLRLSAATASPEATASLARDLRADRDGTIRKLVGQRHAPELPRLPLVVRRRISRQITALVGKRGAQEGPRLPGSIAAELPRLLARLLISVAILVFGKEAGSSQPSLPPDHPCADLERKMCAAYDLAYAAQQSWVICRTGGTGGGGGGGGGGGDSGGGGGGAPSGGVIFEDGPVDPSPGPSGGSAEDCEELWQRSLDRSEQWLQAANAFNGCMQSQTK
jgi:hypothetical protein